MVTRILLLILIIGFCGESFSQVATFTDETISSEKIYLFGPANVSKYFDEQADLYVEEYRELEERVETAMSETNKKYEQYKNKKIRHEARMGELRQQLEKYEMELELLSEFILMWKAHQKTYSNFKTHFTPLFRADSCYCFQVDPDSLCNSNITVHEVDPTDASIYEEFLKYEYRYITRAVKPGELEKARNSRNRRGVKINDATTDYSIRKGNLYWTLRSVRTTKENYNKPRTEVTDYGIRIVERLFSDLIYDPELHEVYLEVDYSSENTSIWIIDNETGLLIPSTDWEKIYVCGK